MSRRPVKPEFEISASQISERQGKYLKLFSLQAGTCITSAIGTGLMLAVILYNIYAPNRLVGSALKIVEYLFVYFYSLIMLIGFSTILVSSLLANWKVTSSGLLLTLFGFICWVILSAVGFTSLKDAFIYVCIDNRCPESHWMYDTRWRNYGFTCPFQSSKKQQKNETETENLVAYYAGCEHGRALPIITSAFFFLAWTVFIVYGLWTVYLFSKELRHLEYEESSESD